jgi:hypothetical protein
MDRTILSGPVNALWTVMNFLSSIVRAAALNSNWVKLREFRRMSNV